MAYETEAGTVTAARKKAALRGLVADQQQNIKKASVLKSVASLIWIAQAFLVAWLFSHASEGDLALFLLLGVAGGFFLLALARSALSASADLVLERAADEVTRRTRTGLLAEQSGISPYDPQAPSSATVSALLVDKCAFLRPYITRYAPAYMRVMVVPLVILILAFSMSWVIGITLLITGPLIPVFMALIGMAAQKASERQMDEISSMNELLLERLGALLDIRLLAARDKVIRQFDEGADKLRHQTMQVLKVAFLSSTMLELFSALGVALIAVYVGFALLGEISFGAWTTPLTLFEGVFLLLLAPDFFQPLRDLSAAWHDRACALAVAKDIAVLNDTDFQKMIPCDGATALPPPHGHIEWQGLSFAGPPAFSVIDGSVAPGEAVVLSGPSGVGKSTLIASLAGVITPVAGEVNLDGAALYPQTVAALRQHIAWIPQTPFFFNASLRDNLTLGRPPQRTLEEALSIASASHIVDRLPEGLDTQLGENGAGVSGGEARRLLLARAACRKPVLVLADEPTADLDDETATQVINALLALRTQGATLIAASHDPRLIDAFDREIAL